MHHLSTELALRAFEADASFSAALAACQAEFPPGIGPIEAARMATAHGFSWLSRPSGPGFLEVRLRHCGGADAAAEGSSAAELLAGLLGIVWPAQAQTPEPEKLCKICIDEDQAPEPVEAAAESLAAATNGALVSDPAEPDPCTPLTPEQRTAALDVVKALTAAQRQAFTISFRDAFRVDRSAKAIAPLITELRHLEFCDRWTLEAAGEVAA
jgi:hypothetical protein